MSRPKFLQRLVNGVGARLVHLANVPPPPPTLAQQRVAPWAAIDGDRIHRVDYDLNDQSVVFDLGGYQGDWASDIFSRFCCAVHIFEPVALYADLLRERFKRNPKMKVHQFGLASADSELTMRIAAERSSAFGDGGEPTPVQLKSAADFFQQNSVDHIDLMKVNIEGGEYDLIEHLLNTGFVARIDNLQVQFHDFVPDAETRMRAIQARLAQTHETTFQFPFIWENWRIKQK